MGWSSSAAAPARRRRGVLFRLYTSNPFYVISADLVFIGLRASFDASGRTPEAGALMLALLGYTLLLAATACVLIRLGEVWDDVRTILLLVVAMFLAISATFDETLARNPGLGIPLYLGGLAFAAAVSEGVLRGVRLRLPIGFKAPYYLILGVFFLYPVALTPLLLDPDDPRLQWMLFGFSTASALAFSTLIPAVRRGPRYVADNGGPWRHPLYPWVLFGLLALAVCGRAYYVCISLHFVGRSNSIFGPYFLVPFALALDLLLLEGGVAARSGKIQRAAILVLPAVVALATLGNRPDPVYQGFLATFERGLYCSPLEFAIVGAMLFCGVATLRRVPLALGGLTVALVALAFADRGAWEAGDPQAVRLTPLLAASAIEFMQAARRRESVRAFVGSVGLTTATVVGLDRVGWGAFQWVAAFHLAIAALMAIGILFDDDLARGWRPIGAVGLGGAVVFATWSDPTAFARYNVPAGWITAYPFIAVGLLFAYGGLARDRFYGAVAAAGVASWIGGAGWRTYTGLRRSIAGLDWIAWGLLFFALAAAVSLRKAGVVDRRRGRAAVAKTVDPSSTMFE